MRSKFGALITTLADTLLVSTALFLMIGCHRTAPQRPTRLGESRADSTLLRMMAMNEHLTEQADRTIMQWIGEQPDQWSQLESGAWYRKISSTPEPVTNGQSVRLCMQVSDLREHLICDIERTVITGKEEGIPTAVADALQEGLIRDSIVLACPWYVGFGPHGNEFVEAYENIIIKVYTK